MNTKQLELSEIVKLVEGKVVCGSDFNNRKVSRGFASDLLSDVLTLDSSGIILITGLSNLQTIRTAEMSDISQIVFVRDKAVTPEMCAIAHENNIVLIQSKMSMFRAVGLLYSAGLSPVY